MELEYIDIRDALGSGGSAKVTIPMKMVKQVWKKVEEEPKENLGRPGEIRTLTSPKNFPVCFIRGDAKLIIELPENAMRSLDYPEDIREKIRQEWSKYQRRLLADEWDKLCEKCAKGNLSELEIEEQFSKLRTKFKEMARSQRAVFSERELHFISADKLDQLIVNISIDNEREKDESFLSLIDDATHFNNELKAIKNTLRELEHGFSEGRVARNNTRY